MFLSGLPVRGKDCRVRGTASGEVYKLRPPAPSPHWAGIHPAGRRVSCAPGLGCRPQGAVRMGAPEPGKEGTAGAGGEMLSRSPGAKPSGARAELAIEPAETEKVRNGPSQG